MKSSKLNVKNVMLKQSHIDLYVLGLALLITLVFAAHMLRISHSPLTLTAESQVAPRDLQNSPEVGN